MEYEKSISKGNLIDLDYIMSWKEDGILRERQHNEITKQYWKGDWPMK